MGMNSLECLENALTEGTNEIFVDETVAEKALQPLKRMVSFAESNNFRIRRR